MPRIQLIKPPTRSVDFIPSGSTMLDLVLDGGWALGRVSNLVGDKSSGKTLLAIEACANFSRMPGVVPEDIWYAEAEAAFDAEYARTMGLPTGINLISAESDSGITTIEEFAAQFAEWLESRKGNKPCFAVLDSLDALSDNKEHERELGDATYGTAKARLLSEFFRKYIATMRDKNCHLLVVSQIRDNIGVTFGETKKRSGGRALDFYASQVVWLAVKGNIERTALSAKRVVGVHVVARNKKNKVGMPFRQAEFPILFNYGVDDETAMLDWLELHKAGAELPEGESLAGIKKRVEVARRTGDRATLLTMQQLLRAAVTKRWREIETLLKPEMPKYV